jgi:hypothetical protein
LQRRNLSFYTRLTEGSLRLDFNLKDVPETFKFTPYAFAGVSIFHFNSYSYLANNKVYLQPLGTEGQGLPEYPGRKPYMLTQFAIPFGAGLTYALSNSIMVSSELCFRKLFTDYLDDVSKLRYVDTAILREEAGDLAAKMSFRSDETNNPFRFSNKLKRGNPKKKDTYYTAVIKLSFSINNGSFSNNGQYSKKVRKQSRCPQKTF